MRVALFSSLAKNTGCWLKLNYLARALRKCGVDVVVFEPLPAMPLFLDFLLSIPWNIVRVLACRCEVVFGAKPFLHITLPFLLRKWIRGTWTVVDVDDLDWEYRRGVLRTAVRLMQTACTRYMDLVTYHNDALAGPLERDFRIAPEKRYALRQGVDFDVFDRDRLWASPGRKSLPARYGIAAGEEVLVYSAHLNAASCLDGILEAVRLVRRDNRGLKLLVIGGGDREPEYRRMAAEMGLAEAVIFTGYLPPEEVAAHVLLGEIALVYYDDGPATRYRCSMKLRELLGMGRIVVCNRTGAAPEFAPFLVMAEAGMPSMAEAIRTAIRDKPVLRLMADQGQAFVRATCDWAAIGAAFARELTARLDRRRADTRPECKGTP